MIFSRDVRGLHALISLPIVPDTVFSSSLAQDVELDLQVWKCTKGSFLGNENDPSAWKCLGQRKQVMNVIEFEQGEVKFDPLLGDQPIVC